MLRLRQMHADGRAAAAGGRGQRHRGAAAGGEPARHRPVDARRRACAPPARCWRARPSSSRATAGAARASRPGRGGSGRSVVVTEVDPGRALEAVLDGHRVMPMAQAAPLGDVFLTATGSRDVLRARALRGDARRRGAGQRRPLRRRGRRAGAGGRRRRGARGCAPHVDEHVLPDGRRLLLLAEGRLVNLSAADGHPAAVMDVSFAVQALTLEHLAAHDARPGVHEVPAAIDAEVARTRLAARGVGLDVLTPGAGARTCRAGVPCRVATGSTGGSRRAVPLRGGPGRLALRRHPDRSGRTAAARARPRRRRPVAHGRLDEQRPEARSCAAASSGPRRSGAGARTSTAPSLAGSPATARPSPWRPPGCSRSTSGRRRGCGSCGCRPRWARCTVDEGWGRTPDEQGVER